MKKLNKFVVRKEEADMCKELHDKAWRGLLFGDEMLKDKLKTTPDAGLTMFSKSFNMSKLWKLLKKKLIRY